MEKARLRRHCRQMTIEKEIVLRGRGLVDSENFTLTAPIPLQGRKKEIVLVLYFSLTQSHNMVKRKLCTHTYSKVMKFIFC